MKNKQLYDLAKQCRIGEYFKCPSCEKSTLKTSYHHTFCSNKGVNNCKDKYHNQIIGLSKPAIVHTSTIQYEKTEQPPTKKIDWEQNRINKKKRKNELKRKNAIKDFVEKMKLVTMKSFNDKELGFKRIPKQEWVYITNMLNSIDTDSFIDYLNTIKSKKDYVSSSIETERTGYEDFNIILSIDVLETNSEYIERIATEYTVMKEEQEENERLMILENQKRENERFRELQEIENLKNLLNEKIARLQTN